MTRIVIIAQNLRHAESFGENLIPMLDRLPTFCSPETPDKLRGLRNAIVFLYCISVSSLPTEMQRSLRRTDVALIHVMED